MPASDCSFALTITMNRIVVSPVEFGSAGRRHSLELEHRADFHGPLPRPGNAPGDLDRLVEVRRVDEEVAAELLSGFGERAVGHLALSLADADAGRGGDRL